MKNKKITIALLAMATIQVYGSDDRSPRTVATNLSNRHLEKLDKLERFDDEDDFHDAQQGFPLLSSKDITALDEYSGIDKYFDDLHQFAKRDLYLAQQNEKMFPDKVHSYENLKNYYVKLCQQREQMALMKEAIKKSLHHNASMLDLENFDPEVRSKVNTIELEIQKIFNANVQRPSNSKMLVDYKVPYEPQLKINELKLLQTRVMQDALHKRTDK